MSSVYLTIDDAPSSLAFEKLEFLEENNIKAVWFLLGKNIEEHESAVIEIIRRGHVVGNHSFSHPHFALTSLKKIQDEIEGTEELLNHVYKMAGVNRPAKIFRLPYGETGGFFKKRQIYALLEELKFESGDFESVEYGRLFRNKAGDRHWMWSYDVREWALAKDDFRNLSFDQVKKNLYSYLDSYSRDRNQIILMHDHEKTHAEFCTLVTLMIERGIRFGDPIELLKRKSSFNSVY